MALRHWVFLYTAPGLPETGELRVVETPACKTVLAGVPNVDAGVRLAPELVAGGAQMIELCGGFGPVGTARVIAAIKSAVPVGSVAYGPESVSAVHAIFA